MWVVIFGLDRNEHFGTKFIVFFYNFRFCNSILQFHCWKTDTVCIVIVCVNDVIFFDIKNAEKRYAFLNCNNKTIMNMTCVILSMTWVTCG